MNKLNLSEAINEYYLMVIFNWETIRSNDDIMRCLDINNNNMCKTIKSNNPSLRDEFVQARVFTIMIMMAMLMSGKTMNIETNNNIALIDVD